VSWSYDKTYELTREWRSGANSYAITYTYDAVGNRLTKKDGGALTTYSYDAANQTRRIQDSTGNTTYTFDGAGSLSLTRSPSNQRTSYTWDGEGRLTQVSLPTGTANTFTYNGDGQRVQKLDSTGTTKLIWDLQNVLVETDTTNVVQAVFTIEPVAYGNLVSHRRGAATLIYHYDGLGSMDRLSDANGTVSDSYLYRAFGSVTTLSGTTTNSLKYCGRLGYAYDMDIALYYLRNRFYDPSLGRFISRDKLRSHDIELYSYVLNNPVNATDPTGMVQKLNYDPEHELLPVKFPPCGGFYYASRWRLAEKSRSGSCIIQKVSLNFNLSKCSTGEKIGKSQIKDNVIPYLADPKLPSMDGDWYTYYECWTVPPDSVYTDYNNPAKLDPPPGPDDRWGAPDGLFIDVCGWYELVFEATFYEGKKCPRDWKATGKPPGFGLPTSQHPPLFPPSKGPPDDPTAVRHMAVEVNCCKPGPCGRPPCKKEYFEGEPSG
jgi:RHS repeat-associated protein